MKLMIVESPTKVKKIKSFLSDDWIVAASIGHIRDLPESEMGFDPPDFKPKYATNSDKKKTVKNLKSLVAKANEVYLATDPDREGEAIAFHLKEALRLKNPKRITFNEITKNAVLKAITSARNIDDNLRRAQEARRVLDRIVGYEVSAILSAQAGKALSAGRVQSPAVKLVALREKQIREFRKNIFYSVEIILENGIKASLIPKDWADDGKHIFSKSIAQLISSVSTKVTVESVSIDDKSINPRPPFITSTLQQAASNRFKFSPSETMEIAQSLFEQGAISYHRTDLQNLSPETFEVITKFANSIGKSTQEKQIVFAKKKDAQEAHEAIRPTKIEKEEEGLNDKERKLYALIRERALASVLKPAIDCITIFYFRSVEQIETDNKTDFAIFRVAGRVEKSSGWRSVCSIEKVDGSKNDLPVLVRKGELFESQPKIVEKETEPPSRLTEANLIKALEKLGIGRPSTYASILENIKDRNYIEVKKFRKEQKIVPTELGETLTEALRHMSFMNLDYTRIIEDSLDKISLGKMSYKELVTHVYQEVSEQLQKINIPPLIETVSCPLCTKPIKQLNAKKKPKVFFWVHLDDQNQCKKYISDSEVDGGLE